MATRARTSRIVPALAAAALGLSACPAPRTEVLVKIDSNAPPARELTVRVELSRGDGADGSGGGETFTFNGPLSTSTLPASFAAVADRAADARVTLTLDALLAADGAGAPAVRFRRVARFAFVPHVTTVVPIFLAVGCGDAALGCTAGPSAGCTLSELCAEQGETCGDDAACVPLDITPQPADAGGPAHSDGDPVFDVSDIAAPPGADASIDVVSADGAKASEASVDAAPTCVGIADLVASDVYHGDTCAGTDSVMDACNPGASPETVFRVPYGLGAPDGASYGPMTVTSGFVWYVAAAAGPDDCQPTPGTSGNTCSTMADNVSFNPAYTQWIVVERLGGKCGAFTLSVTRNR